MFTEVQNIRQIKGEPRRRWFADEDLELIVWLGRGDKIIGFQLCYQSNGKSKALTWQEHDGFLHSRIDDGEGRPGYYKAAPILIPDGTFDKKKIGNRFAASGGTLSCEITDFVKARINEYKKEDNRS